MLAFSSIPMEIPYPQHPTPSPAFPALFVFFWNKAHTDDVCYVGGLPHIYKVTMFIFHKNRYTYLKISSQVHKTSIVILYLIVVLAGTWQTLMFIQLASFIKLNELKLESYRLFKEILLRFRYILAISRGYIVTFHC